MDKIKYIILKITHYCYSVNGYTSRHDFKTNVIQLKKDNAMVNKLEKNISCYLYTSCI